jgi:glycosyltransferase involved in cell wall biosynthesis
LASDMTEALAKRSSGAAHAPGGPPRDGARLRVAFVTDIPTPYMLEVLKALGGLVDLTALFCSRTGSRGMPWAPREELPFAHEVIEGLTVRSGAPDRPDYYLSPRILAALARTRAEAIVSAGFSIPTGYAAIYGRLRRAPLIIYSDGTSHYESSLGRHQLAARAVLLRAASACVAKSKPAAERFIELGVRPDRVFLAPHSSTLDRLWAIADQRDYHGRGRFTVLTAGRLVPHKGVDKLLAAAAVARERHPEIRLVVVGSGPDEQRLRALASDLDLDVEFAGFVDHAEMPARYAEADAFAFPTLDDPFGIVLLEAAAAGLPLIASPHGGATWDLVDDGTSGLIVDPNDTPAFAGALADLAGDPDRRGSLGRRSRQATLGRSPGDSARGYVSAIEAAMRDPGRAKR